MQIDKCKSVLTKSFDQIYFFHIFSFLFNLRFIGIYLNYLTGIKTLSQVSSNLLILAIIYYLPLLTKYIKKKETLIVFILVNILGLYYGVGRSLVSETFTLISWLKPITLPFLIGMSFQVALLLLAIN